MKILENFNTNLDQIKIHEKSFVIKQYPMYIFQFKNILLYISFMIVLYFFIGMKQKIFWSEFWIISNLIYLSIIGWWLFSSWQFLYHYVNTFQEYYDLKNKHLLKKQDKIYDKTLKFSFILLFLNLCLLILSIFYWFYTQINLLTLLIFWIMNIFLIWIQWCIIKSSLIDFEMVFTYVDWKTFEVAQMEQNWFFHINHNAASFNLISSVDGSSKGIIRSWLNYWYIEIVTMGTKPNIIMKYVKNPSWVARLIQMAKNTTPSWKNIMNV